MTNIVNVDNNSDISGKDSKVAAVVVLYHPDTDALMKNLESVAGDVKRLYLIDNTPDTDLSATLGLPEKYRYIPLKRNTGIAHAQNVGIKEALNEGADFILLLDQDSTPPPGMTPALTRTFLSLHSEGYKVGGVGPRPYNALTETPFKASSRETRVSESVVRVRELISSGTLLSAAVIRECGLMDESLFIDDVDHEWCWRAGAKGNCLFINEKVFLNHKLGQGDRRLLNRKVAIPAPVRTYYLYRNFFILAKRGYTPLHWKLTTGLKQGLKIFYYPIFIAPRRQYASNIFRGIRDGVKSLFS